MQCDINSVYEKFDEFGNEEFASKLMVDGEMVFYGETEYGKFDDYLVSQQFNEFN